eukprot:15439337-Alexandrium_andersonii.AAC.1
MLLQWVARLSANLRSLKNRLKFRRLSGASVHLRAVWPRARVQDHGRLASARGELRHAPAAVRPARLGEVCYFCSGRPGRCGAGVRGCQVQGEGAPPVDVARRRAGGQAPARAQAQAPSWEAA